MRAWKPNASPPTSPNSIRQTLRPSMPKRQLSAGAGEEAALRLTHVRPIVKCVGVIGVGDERRQRAVFADEQCDPMPV